MCLTRPSFCAMLTKVQNVTWFGMNQSDFRTSEGEMAFLLEEHPVSAWKAR